MGISLLLWAPAGYVSAVMGSGYKPCRVKVMETRRAKYRSEHNVIPIQIRTDIFTAQLIKLFKGTLPR